MFNRRHMLLLAGAAAMPWPGRALAQTNAARHALIIGNASYSEGIGPLANPLNDARLVADGILECGFTLVTGDIVRDADRSTMMKAIRDYASALQDSGPDSVGFFYYSGHGAAREGEGNYLIPVEDAQMLDEALWDDSVEIDWIMEKLTACEAPNVMALDACRNVLKLPEAQRALGGGESFRGIRRTAGGADQRNMFLSFATWEGETASDGRAEDGHGPYARSLGQRLIEPAVTVRDMFEQVRLDVLEKTAQRQEPMNLSRLQRRSSDVKIGAWNRAPASEGPRAPASQNPLRVALVFSNDYEASGAHALPNTHTDGEKVSSALADSGYKVHHIRNAGLEGFQNGLTLLQNSLNAAGPASVGLVYFAGYGASLFGEDNYLIPNGPLPTTEEEVMANGAKLQDAVEFLEFSKAQAVILMVDCGRKYESMGTKGMEPGFADYTADSNVVIAYADKPGTTRPDAHGPSVFADAFARRIRSPDRIDINTVMQQVSGDVIAATDNAQQPWFQTSVRLPVFFRADVEEV